MADHRARARQSIRRRCRRTATSIAIRFVGLFPRAGRRSGERRHRRLWLRQFALGRESVRARRARSRHRPADRGDERSRSRRRAPTAWCCPASAPLPIAGAGSTPSTAWSTRSNEACAKAAGRSSASASACSLWPNAAANIEVTQGLGWIAGEVDRITPSDPHLKIPHMGWNTLNVTRPHPLLDGIALGPDGLHAYFVHSYALKPRTARRSGGGSRLWRPAHRDRRPRQHCRYAISSREKPEARACADCQLSEVEAVILFPAIDLKERRSGAA